ncbi:MAG: hypothetical protein Q7T70_01815 [Polaromonas sp.]|nr:hypothetical protein [Polaromonas sp.]
MADAKKPAATPAAPKAADSDLLGEAVTIQPPGPADAGEASQAGGSAAEPPPAEDENQPGFIGERNRPHP